MHFNFLTKTKTMSIFEEYRSLLLKKSILNKAILDRKDPQIKRTLSEHRSTDSRLLAIELQLTSRETITQTRITFSGITE